MVLGDAVWPCVRDNMGWLASCVASSFKRAIKLARKGSITSSRAVFNIRPCDRLLMSSEVQAKWMNSLALLISGLAANLSFSQYSNAFTS